MNLLLEMEVVQELQYVSNKEQTIIHLEIQIRYNFILMKPLIECKLNIRKMIE